MTIKSPHPIYSLFRGPEGGMVTMDYQDMMVDMELQGDKETLVCRDHLGHKVCTLNLTYIFNCYHHEP